MGRIFKWLGSREQMHELWQNKEALAKYLNRLKELMMANPDCRMTEDETETAARIRSELWNSGLHGKGLIVRLKERLLEEGIKKPVKAGPTGRQ